MANRFGSTNVFDRLNSPPQWIDLSIDDDCYKPSFSPAVNPISHAIDAQNQIEANDNAPRWEKLYQNHENQKHVLEEKRSMRQLEEEHEVSQYSFKPKLVSK